MRFALLVGLVIATASCAGYHFPGPESGTGTVRGQVIALGCGGPIQPDAAICPAKASIACPRPSPPVSQTCDRWPMAGFQLTFTNGGSSQVAKTDSAGAYSIDLPAGTWKVSASNYARIISGPQTVDITAGAVIVADYVVDTGMRAAA